jgi:hypothetical protein
MRPLRRSVLLTFLNNPKEKKSPTRKVSLHVDLDKISSTIFQEKRTEAPRLGLGWSTQYDGIILV